MGTKKEELESTTGCLAKCANDEPIFVLRAQDVLAPGIIRAWVAQVSRQHMVHRSRHAPPSPNLLAKLEEAEHLAFQMEAWQAENGSKVPD